MNTMSTVGAAIAEGVAVPHNGREARNLAEKHRRDKLNASIQELATMVPHVADSARRLDKTAVLRFAAHGLRLQYVFGKSGVKKMRSEESIYAEPHTTDTLMQLLNSFFITLTCHGQIVLISTSVEQILGHCQSDLYGQNILNITHHEDQAILRQQLIPRDMESLFRNNYDMNRSVGDEEYDEAYDSDELHDVKNTYYHTPNSKTQTNFAKIDQKLRSDKRSFIVRLARASTRSEETRYEFVKIEGCFRRSDFSTSAGNFPIVSQLIRRSRNNGAASCGGPSVLQHDAIAQAALHGISGNDIVLVAIARLIKPPSVSNRLIEGNVLEYRTRHLIDGRIVDCDQRIGLVAGYMKEEVRNLSPFSFIHQDDVRWVIVALRQMYDGVADYGESCYRLLSRNGQFIYLQTQGYFEIDKTTNRVHSFVCINTLLDEDVGRRRVQEMKRKFSIFIQTKMPSNSVEDVPASQNPQQLERIVLYLIEDLQKRHELNGKPLSATPERVSCTNDRKRAVKTPPIALVAPETDSVRSSITKSVNIINITAAKNLYRNPRSPGSQYSEASLSPASSNGHFEECTESNILPTISTQRPSVLQMNLVPQVS
ncbi:aryl hydrocarbon receptor nuclear translocator-like protein 1 [Teleopsis dalmanni]|uniref:aryl hydrocarbon receptor nuclear translocator-like protein 1 n=1 Tax=Teleopsis dalmanni TaxID=139649 RepID=UPI0018CF96DE|nr:aryl hydrocarbon receptor nuclear translocator-like protein 1 [Teleopsis dalmanni]